MLEYLCVRTIGVLSFIDNAAGCLCQSERCVVNVTRLCAVCLCQNDRCVVIVHRQCCRMFVPE